MSNDASPGLFRTEIYWSRLAAAVDEAAFALVRTAYSGVVRENLDFACGLFDGQARLLVQDRVGTPGLAGPMPGAIRGFLSAFPSETLVPGDVLITNDPWIVSGHKHDTTVLTPIFDGTDVIGFAMSVAHQIDIGGRGMTLESRDVFEEGLAIRPAKLFDAGKRNETLWEVIGDNVRFPEMVLGDIEAQIASNQICASHLSGIRSALGATGFLDLAQSIIERTEATTRKAIASIPEGSYRSRLNVERPGSTASAQGEPLHLDVTITTKNGSLTVDYAGTSPQVAMAFNSPLNGLTTSYTLMALKCVLDPEMPMNHGFMEPITIQAPEGCLLNPRRPASVRGRNYLAHTIPELIFGALVDAVPDRVIAPSGTAPAWNQQIEGTTDSGGKYAHFFPIRGGLGARPDRDGISCISFPTNVSTLQVEVLEADAPLIVEKKEFRIDSGGPGKFRGGCGQEVTLRIRDGMGAPHGPVYVGIQGGRLGEPIEGYMGGGTGLPGSIALNGERIGAGRLWQLRAGDRIEYKTPGGGGYHHPSERHRSAVEADVRDGLVSSEAAKEVYGVEV